MICARAVLTSSTPGFIRANCSGPIRPWVSGVNATQIWMTSAVDTSSSNSSSGQAGVARRPAPVGDVHAEHGADFGNPPPDGPEADDGKSLAAKLETLVSLPDAPRTPLDGAVELRHPTGECQHQQQRVFADGMRGAARSVHHGDTRCPGGDGVDVVEPGPAPADDLRGSAADGTCRR